ncbi:MAG: hypothetical protein H6657_07620 [Ardenticatenaceae bacterium]|nr:hypothetical protein [Ardenticatenaceae bacterium]
MCTTTIGLNTQTAPFDDVRVRQAFNYALDKQLLIDTFSGGDALVATGALPPGMPGYTADASRGYPFDPAKANQLLDEAGYTDRATFPVLTYNTSGYGDVGGYETAVISLWQDVLGVTIQPVVVDPFIYYDELYAGNTGNLYTSGWCADYPTRRTSSTFCTTAAHGKTRGATPIQRWMPCWSRLALRQMWPPAWRSTPTSSAALWPTHPSCLSVTVCKPPSSARIWTGMC